MSRFLTVANGIRLSLFALAYGVVGVLVAGTLNRVLLVEVGLSKALVGLIFALPYLESPIRVWLGYRSDGYPVLGRRREPLIIIGAIVGGIAVVAVTWITVRIAPGSWSLLAALTLSLLLYGFGRSLAHNSFQALLTDKYVPRTRRSVATLFEVVTLVGSVIAGGLIGARLEVYDPAVSLQISLAVMAVFILCALLAAPWQEPRNPDLEAEAARAKEQPFWKTVQTVLLPDPQVRIFFALILCAFVGTLAQDVWLEGYGGEVFGMSVGDTTRLTQYWGPGVLLSMLLSGVSLMASSRRRKRYAKTPTEQAA
jgi:BCD family chlorophyll transporter-like MFS transporter